MERVKVDTLVVGAGLIGSSVAMHLAGRGVSVRVVDVDLEGTLSSSELNAGGVRATWNQPLNIAMSKFTIDYFGTVADEVGYRPCGYLWLHAPGRIEQALRARERQLAMGWEVEAWDVAELTRRVPFIDKTDGIAGALFAPRDGLINSNLLKQHFRARARAAGAIFEDRTWLRGAELSQDGRVVLKTERFERALTHDEKIAEYSGRDCGVPRVAVQYEARRVVNCAGPWAARVAEMLGYTSPSYCSRRQVCLFDCKTVDLNQYGMIVDTTGVYFHPEASYVLSGFGSPDEPRGVNYDYDGESFFMEVIWPSLYERSTQFEALRHLSGWGGLYEISPDESAIIGRASNGEAARHGGIFEAHSFSGHGVMHSHAAGLAMAELLVDGAYRTIDAAPLSGSRFETGALLHEGMVI